MKKRILYLLLLQLLTSYVSHGQDKERYLLPVDAEQTGWNYNRDLGWSYLGAVTDQGVWFWINRGSGRWYFSSANDYPAYWNFDEQRWDDIHRSIIQNESTYSLFVDEDYFRGYEFGALEAYVQVQGPTDTQSYMRPGVSFSENNVMEIYYSDTVERSHWALVDLGLGGQSVITGSSWVGDYLIYNPNSEILFIDGHKFTRHSAD